MPKNIEGQPRDIPDAEVFKFLMEEISQNMGLANLPDMDTEETLPEEDEVPEDPSKI